MDAHAVVPPGGVWNPSLGEFRGGESYLCRKEIPCAQVEVQRMRQDTVRLYEGLFQPRYSSILTHTPESSPDKECHSGGQTKRLHW